MTIDSTELKNKVFKSIKSLLKDQSINISDDTALLGHGSLLDSMRLVELCLMLEDIASDHHFEFDWTSDVAMSRSRSMFRTAGTLSATFIEQGQKKP